MDYHKVLQKQISRYLPAHYSEDAALLQFLSAVNNAYLTFEKDKKMSEHAFAISEREYQEVTKNLRLQNRITTESISKLKEALVALNGGEFTPGAEGSDDLINIIASLQQQIIKTKQLELELKHAKEIAESAANAKSDFLSVMSHEIRTPLNAIIGYIHLLQQEDPLPSQVDFLRILQISADNLLSLINDVLDFGKIEEGKIVFAEKDVDIRQLANNIKLANLIRAEEKGNRIKVLFDEDIPTFIKTDATRLSQVLNNLISNAIKFTHNGNITIEAHLTRMNVNCLEIYFAVTDTGIGIPEDKQQIIFERFTQQDSDITRKYGGSGLGLAIIRKLLHLQQSEIFVKSEPGRGSTFYFTLRFAKSNMVKKEESMVPKTVNDLQQMKILLVEDVEFNILLAQKMLGNWNAQVTLAENGEQAVQRMQEAMFDIVLMDLQMPVMDGLTASRLIRGFDRETPIIALTASTSSQVQDQVTDCGMNDYVAKPLNPQNLYSTIVKHTFERELHQD